MVIIFTIGRVWSTSHISCSSQSGKGLEVHLDEGFVWLKIRYLNYCNFFFTRFWKERQWGDWQEKKTSMYFLSRILLEAHIKKTFEVLPVLQTINQKWQPVQHLWQDFWQSELPISAYWSQASNGGSAASNPKISGNRVSSWPTRITPHYSSLEW